MYGIFPLNGPLAAPFMREAPPRQFMPKADKKCCYFGKTKQPIGGIFQALHA
jgi:hypothetical protein